MNTATTRTTTITYDDRTVRQFMIASIVWGIVGMLVGVICATQLSWWQMNGKFIEAISGGLFKGEGLQYITFGRLRPLHTNAVIFAFVGNMMFAGIYYSTQRLCKCRTASDLLSKIHMWGWQLIIVAAAITLPAGLTRGKEYAELIWPINIAVALIWVVFGINFFWTLAKRNEPSLYVALWFYIATIVTIAMLYIVNHLSIPTSILHSYPVFGGFADGLVQWLQGRMPVTGKVFLTHGEPDARSGLASRLMRAGVEAEAIVTPMLDSAFALTATEAQPLGAVGRLRPGAASRPDWRNGRAALLGDINEALQGAPDDEAREALLARLRDALEAPSRLDIPRTPATTLVPGG